MVSTHSDVTNWSQSMHALALAMVLAHSLVLNATVDVNCLKPVTVLRLHLGL